MYRICRIGGTALAMSLAASQLGAQTGTDSSAAHSGDTASAASHAGHKPPKAEPFAFADFTWLTGNSREKSPLLDTKYFTGEFRADINYIGDFDNPKDHTLDGAAEAGRTGEVQVQQLGIGGDFHYDNVRGRFMTQFGMYSELTASQ